MFNERKTENRIYVYKLKIETTINNKIMMKKDRFNTMHQSIKASVFINT